MTKIPSSYPLEVKDDVLFGSDSGTQETNANVNNYNYLYFEVTDFVSERAVRVFFWDPNQNKRIDYFLKPVADKESADYTQNTTVSGNGTYCVKIPDGARLQGAKTPWTSAPASDPYFKFSEIYLTERATPYVELVPYTLVFSEGKAVIPISESHIRTTGNVSINYSTGEVTNTGSGNLIIYLNNENLIGASLYHVDIEGTNLEPVLGVTDAVNGEVGGIYGSRFNWNIAGDASRNTKIGSITAFNYSFSNTGSMTIKEIYILADELIAETTNKALTSLPYGTWAATANKVSQYIADDNYKTNNISGSASSMVYGHDANNDANKYVDLTNCSKMTFTGFSSDGKIRLFYNWDGTDANKPIEIIEDFPTTSGTYVLDVDVFKKSKNITFFHLIGIKAGVGGTVTLTSVTVDEYTNVISGKLGIDRTKNYLANPYITSIDATGMTNSSAIELTSANANCLFIANSGKLSNTKNVIVGSTCANLELTDGKPFKAPADFVATATTYTGRSFTAAQATTVCLPFALTSTEASTLGKFYEYSSFDGSTLHFSQVAAPLANTPYFVIPEATSLTLSEADKTIVATPATLNVTANNVDFIGTLEATTIPASDGTYSYYAYNNGDFVKITTAAATLPAFRAYFKVLNSAISSSAPALNICFDEFETTGIKDVKNAAKSMNGYYNLSGQQVTQPTKGLYIVNGKKVVIK